MKNILTAIVIAAFMATGSSAVLAKDMNSQNMSRVMVKQVAKQQKAEAERHKAQLADAAKASAKNK